MSVIQREVSIAAGATNDNLFSGSAFEFALADQVVSLGVTAAATGTFATLQSGGTVIAEEFPPAVATRYPIIPDEFYYNAVQAKADRLVLRVRNPTAGAIVVRSIAQTQPIGR